MSRIENIKNNFPHLNVTVLDILSELDKSSTKKYLPLICKIFGKRFSFSSYNSEERVLDKKKYIKEVFDKLGLKYDGLSDDVIYTKYCFLDFFNYSDFDVFNEFVDNSENKRLDNKDIWTYTTLEQLMRANSLCSLKKEEKNMEGQVIKEYEDESWLIVRPLTFNASSKYGAGTKWCTTMSNEKSYFAKYWSRGVLLYFINKKTGYKFAGFKSITDEDELSFYNAEDKRTELFNLEIDDYLFPIMRNILKSEKTNKNLCSEKLIEYVESECNLEKIYEDYPQPQVVYMDLVQAAHITPTMNPEERNELVRA